MCLPSGGWLVVSLADLVWGAVQESIKRKVLLGMAVCIPHPKSSAIDEVRHFQTGTDRDVDCENKTRMLRGQSRASVTR